MTPQISVIVPTYNRAHTVTRAIDSVLRQDVAAVETIVVDDGSTDGTAKALADYGERIRVIRQENRGVSTARNSGILAARGELIAFLDSDDEWLPGKLSHQLQLIRQHPHVGLVATGAEFLNERGIRVARNSQHRAGRLVESLLYSNFLVTSSVLVRAASLRQMEPLFRTDINTCEDWELWIRLAAHCDFYVSPEIYVRYHVTPDGISRKFDASSYRKWWEDAYAHLRKHRELRAIIESRPRRVKGTIHFGVAMRLYDSGAYWRSRWELVKAMLCAPSDIPLKSAIAILFLPRSLRQLGRQFLAR